MGGPMRRSRRPRSDALVVVTRAANTNPNETLPTVLLEAAAKKFSEDVAGFAALFEENTPTYARPPTLPLAGNMVDIAQGGHKTLLKWALVGLCTS